MFRLSARRACAAVLLPSSLFLSLPSCDERLPAPLALAPAGAAARMDAAAGESIDGGADLSPTRNPYIGFAAITPIVFDRPIEIEARGVGTGNGTYVAEQTGALRILRPNATDAAVVLDLKSRVTAGYDQGLLGFALHPRFPTKPYVYVSYTAPHPLVTTAAFESVIARFESFDGGATFDPTSEKRLLVWDQPGANHNNGAVTFGPDGFLYIGSGDGADPTDLKLQNAQNPNVLLGKILRVDVDGGDPYAIPPGNPFATSGGRPEIYALGLRNPWRFNFDAKTGRLWAGDVGSLDWEEIDEIRAGANYGWGNREGFTCHAQGATCEGNFVEPLAVHSHTEAAAIVGGVFYHGDGIPEIKGKYVYADASSRFFWTLPTDGSATLPTKLLDRAPVRPVSLRLSAAGEILVVDYQNGTLQQLVRVEP